MYGNYINATNAVAKIEKCTFAKYEYFNDKLVDIYRIIAAQRLDDPKKSLYEYGLSIEWGEALH